MQIITDPCELGSNNMTALQKNVVINPPYHNYPGSNGNSIEKHSFTTFICASMCEGTVILDSITGTNLNAFFNEDILDGQYIAYTDGCYPYFRCST